ncbi:MAG: hypothetical protein M1827_001413 [Pycnora praestabilis]|nr:MAG: hypothetical protein M1827_001413 [Pycnora praestabilis]
MTTAIATFVSKKILGETAANRFGKEDPYFEQVPATRLDGRPSKKMKKRRKALPPGLSENDGKVLTKVKRRAYRLDNSLFNCCGIRFGWSSVIGIVPAAGDTLDLFMAYMVVRTCDQIDGKMPSSLRNKMMLNLAIDFFIGLVPFLGDLADAVFRANTRNAVELERFLRKRGAENLLKQGSPHPAIDPSLAEEYDRSDDELGPPPRYTPDVQGGHSTTEPTRPESARIPQETRGGGTWFSWGNRPERQGDVEMGEELPPVRPPRTGDSRVQTRTRRN